jgi:hypothetical protein
LAARRFLAPAARQGDGRGYLTQPDRQYPQAPDEPETVARIATATAMCDEPEALDSQDYKLHVDKRAKAAAEQQRKFETVQRERERRLMNFEQRLATAHEAARARGRDVGSEVRLLRHMRASGKKVRHLEQRLFALERKVWAKAA